MTKEELLRPRYKVINIWPDMDKMALCQGEIITLDKQFVNKQACIRRGDSTLYDAFFDNYPHLFQPLEWWEERAPEDMPKYLKWVYTGVICKYHRHLGAYFYLEDDNSFGYALTNTIPATIADYNAWKNETP
jgi:hypothetical protein